MRIPELLLPERRDDAVEALRCYYGLGRHGEAGHGTFTGARFDTWAHGPDGDPSPHRFTADDIVAVSMLSVHVPAAAALQLLDTQAGAFAATLYDLGPDEDLVDQTQPWDHEWAGSRLWTDLVGLEDVGPTTASKLFARKRPRLRPIYDSVVARVIGTEQIWEPLRAYLQTHPQLHGDLISLRTGAGLPGAVSALRVFDVVAWMQGKDYAPCRWSSVPAGSA